MTTADETQDGQSVDLEKAPQEQPVEKNDETQTHYPSGRKLYVIVVALYLAVLLVALDRTIISTAIPRITDDFHSLGDVGWYGSAYLLTSCSFQLLFGRIYTFYSPKWVFITAIVVFEVGSTLCGAAPSSVVFIVGRAIAGLGSSAIFSGAIVIVMNLVPLHRRPIFTGFLGATFGIASVIGPLLGGALTQRSTWRWCFYLNLPVGGVTILTLVPTLKLPAAMKANTPLRRQIDQLDPLGTLCFLPGVVCLLLALQWGGTTYAWKDGRIIALLVLFGVLMIAFITIQIWRQEMATVPPRIVRNRSIAAGIWFSLCIGGSSMLMVYYLPVWFQAVRGVGAIESGIMVLPLILALTVGSILAGGLVTRFGYYVPFLLASSVIMSIALGLITTFQRDTGHATWIGYQVLYGFGIGLGMQQSGLAAQAVLAKQDVPVGASLMFFSQSLGGAVFVSIGQVVFANRLVSGLEHVSGFDPVRVVNTGATDLRNAFGPASLDIILSAYNKALVNAYEVALALACLSIIGALAMEWKSVKARRDAEAAQAQTDQETAKVSDGEEQAPQT